jgi:hypothetical protein
MSSVWVVGLFLLSLLGADSLQAQRANRSALVYRSTSDSSTHFRLVQPRDSVQAKSNKTRNVLIGMAVGAALGGGTAYVLSRRSCAQGTFVCDEPAPVILPTALFSILGGIGGGTVVHYFGRSRSDRDGDGVPTEVTSNPKPEHMTRN